MNPTKYNSVAPPKSTPISKKSWEVFSKYLSRYQWALDYPCKSPRQTEITHAILNKGKPGSCTFYREEEGYKFVLRPMYEWAIENAINQKRKLYYVSSGKTALLYFDIDLHNAWQTHEEGKEAKRLIEALFIDWFGKSVIFWCDSKRGMNGYLKVSRQGMTPGYANSIFNRLEHALQRFLAFRKNLVDFEIKGTFGYMLGQEYQWGQFGKLPIHNRSWIPATLEEFEEKPTVLLARLKYLCEQIEKQIPQEVLTQHKQHKKDLGNAPITERGFFLVPPATQKALEKKYGETWRWQFGEQHGEDDVWLRMKLFRPGQLPMTEEEWQESQKPIVPAPQIPEEKPAPVPQVKAVPPVIKTPSKLNLDFSDLVNEPDSFKRQKEALFRYARYLKRVPETDEALTLFHKNRLFSGEWSDNKSKRKTRTQSILTFIGQTFDASKCAKGSVNIGKFDEWAKKAFPTGFKGRNRRYLDEKGEIAESHHRTCISAKFISVFMSIAEFALLIDKNKDGSFPHKRAEQVWNALYAKNLITVKFCARKWAQTRERLVHQGIIVITDRNYGPDKAMKWEEGRYFPGLGKWKGKKVESLGVPLVLDEKREDDEHNTLLYKQPLKSAEFHVKGVPRSPPRALCSP